MFDSESDEPEHLLLGTVVVKAVDRDSGNPLSGLSVAVADDLDTACQHG